jgi:hypothetical protein
MVFDILNSPPKPSQALHPHIERNISILQLLCDGISAETSCHPTAEWTIPCILAGNDCSVGCGKPKCVHKFTALSTSSAEALFHVHVVRSDCTLNFPVSSSFPLCHVSVCHHTLNRLYHLFYGHAVLCTVQHECHVPHTKLLGEIITSKKKIYREIF